MAKNKRAAVYRNIGIKSEVPILKELPFFGYDADYKILLYHLHGLYSVVGVIPKEGVAGPIRSVFS